MNLKRCCSYRNARQKLPQAADSALTEFPTAGIYQLWAQFRLADGTVITAPFTLRANESR